MDVRRLGRAVLVCALALAGCADIDGEAFESNPEATGNDLRFIAADGAYRLDYEVTVNECDSQRPSGTRVVDVHSYQDPRERTVWLTITGGPPTWLGPASVVDRESQFQISQSPFEYRGQYAIETSTVRDATPNGLVIDHAVAYLPSADDPAVPAAGCRTEQRWVLTKIGPPRS